MAMPTRSTQAVPCPIVAKAGIAGIVGFQSFARMCLARPFGRGPNAQLGMLGDGQGDGVGLKVDLATQRRSCTLVPSSGRIARDGRCGRSRSDSTRPGKASQIDSAGKVVFPTSHLGAGSS
jgi:hypothetical protein